jgi:hypothetical protein
MVCEYLEGQSIYTSSRLHYPFPLNQVDVAPNSNVTITIKDSNGETAVLANQFVLAGEDDSCY